MWAKGMGGRESRQHSHLYSSGKERAGRETASGKEGESGTLESGLSSPCLGIWGEERLRMIHSLSSSSTTT